MPALTLLAIEEPENNLAPFYLSRIVELVENVVDGPLAQAFISSHSASILGRVNPKSVRHFRLDDTTRSALVRQIVLPAHAEAENKYVREAVRAFPELYFARFVILGEGDSEEIVLPRIARAMGIPIDRSFVAIVPLGGRHVEHFWKLLNELAIPHATLLDLDLGRSGGGWGRIKTICGQLVAIGESPEAVLEEDYDGENIEASLAVFDDKTLDDGYDEMDEWLAHLQGFNVFYCDPLDLDWSMLTAFEKKYTALEAGQSGPSNRGNAARTVLGPEGDLDCYGEDDNDRFKWYRYLFLNRGKPSTHIRVLSSLRDRTLARAVPPELKALLETVATHIEPDQPPPDAG